MLWICNKFFSIRTFLEVLISSRSCRCESGLDQPGSLQWMFVVIATITATVQGRCFLYNNFCDFSWSKWEKSKVFVSGNIVAQISDNHFFNHYFHRSLELQDSECKVSVNIGISRPILYKVYNTCAYYNRNRSLNIASQVSQKCRNLNIEMFQKI